MNTRSLWKLALAGVCLASLMACSSAPSAPDASLLQAFDGVYRASSPQAPVQLRLQSEQVRTGEPINLGVASPKGGYVYLFQLGTEGKKLTLIFPNAMDGANHLAPDAVLQLPRANWRMNTSGPAGVGYVLAVVTEKPLDLMALQANVQAGKFDLPPGYGAAMVPWREVAAQ